MYAMVVTSGTVAWRLCRRPVKMPHMHATRLRTVAVVLFVAACGQATPPTGTPAQATAPASTAGSSLPGPSSASPAPVPSAGFFAFDAESVVGYYVTLGYTCSDMQPSTKAAGYDFRSCRLVDPDGRTQIVGITTDAADDVADAFASVTGAPTETVLDPVVALDPFSRFLGAMLGESQGESTLPWLAAHLGDSYVTTTLGELTIATYTESPEDHSKLYVEIANRAYLDAPAPSGSPAAT
jgi:hypothetical protein